MSAEAPASFLAAARSAQAGLPLLPETGSTIAPGDLIVLADLPLAAREVASGIEWALVEKDPAAAERYLAVPADGLALQGSGDLTIGREGERRSLRCRHPLWLERRSGESWRKTGRLSATELARARRHLQLLAQGEKVGGVLSQEIDESSDYREEITVPLASLLLQLRREPPATAPVIQDRSKQTPLRTWALAATVLVALLSFMLARQLDQLEKLRRQQQIATQENAQKVGQLESSHARLEEEKKRLEDEKAQALESAESTAASLEATRRQLQLARKESVIANPELAILSRPGSTRGGIKVELDPGASHLLVLIPLDGLPRKQKYRLELLGGKEAWTSPELEVLSPGELRLGIPASLLPEGDVTLRLRIANEKVALADYELTIKRP